MTGGGALGSALGPRLALVLALVLAGCSQPPRASVTVVGGDPERGARVIAQVGCGACHEIPGIRGAAGLVGPPLTHLARRTVIAGVLPNTPEALVRWVRAPQSVVPGNAMPDMGLSDQQARDVAAYLGTLE